jgi:hypothetical protein
MAKIKIQSEDDPTHAETMLALFETFLQSNVGVGSINIDGTAVTYNRQQALEEYKFWKSQVARENGSRPTFRGANLGGCW